MTQAKVVLSADASQFDREMGRTGKALSNIDRQLGFFRSTASAAVGVLGAFGGALGVADVLAYAKAINQGVVALEDVAEAAGSSVENVSALEDVARRTGGTLQDVEGILIKFNAALKSAKPDNDAGRLFNALGLDLAELRRIDPAEALLRTAKALQGFADDGNKARAVQELFGRSVREAAGFLNDLAERSELAATATREQTKEAKRLSEEVAALDKNWTDLARTMVGHVVPAINEMLPKLKELLGGEKSKFTLGNELQDVQAQLEKLRAMQGRGFTFLGFFGSEQARRKEIERLEAELATLQQRFSGAASGAGRRPPNEGGGGYRPSLPADLGDGDKPKRRVPTTEDILRNESFNFRRFEISGTDEANAAVAARNLKEYTDQRERLNAVVANTPSAKRRELVTQVELLNKAFDEGKVSLGDWVTESEKLTQALDDLEPQVEKASEELSDFAQEARRNIQDALGETMLRTFKGDTDDIVKLWGDMLLRMAAQAAAADLGKSLLGSGKDGDNGWLGSLFSAVAGAFGGGGGGGAAGRANGGPVAAGSLYEVNERGAPELLNIGNRQFLMMGRQSGYVTPSAAEAGQPAVVNHYTQVNNVAAGVTEAQLVRALQIQRDSLRAEFRLQLQRAGVA